MFLKFREEYLNLIIIILIIKENLSLEYSLFQKQMVQYIYFNILSGKLQLEMIENQMNLKRNIKPEKK